MSRLAQLASEHGNGIVEVTARGNLQVRGLRAGSAAVFAGAAEAVLAVETGLVLDMSPIAGIDPLEIADPRSLAEAIAARAKPFEDRLGPKVSVVVDGGGQIPLSHIKADIRLTAMAGGWAVALGGGKAQAMDADAAVSSTVAMLGALAAIGPDTRATDLFPAVSADRRPKATTQNWPAGGYVLRDGKTIPIALPYGSARSADLVTLARAAAELGIISLRLAPGHCLLIDHAPDALIARAAALGFITTNSDPRRRVSACIGSQGCGSGFIAAREMGARLAERVPAGRHLHISGCSKGCAHPRRADLTLVGRPDGIGLVIGGRAGDTPDRILDEGDLADAFAHSQVPDDGI